MDCAKMLYRAAAVMGILLLTLTVVPTVSAQGGASQRASLEQEMTRIGDQIQAVEDAGGPTPEALYNRYFEILRTLYPHPESGHDRDGNLDQGTENCPGFVVPQPAPGQPYNFADPGNTNNYFNNCAVCGPGRDVVYSMNLATPQRLELSTCGSNFNTKLCVFKDTCCNGTNTPVMINDNANPPCQNNRFAAVINNCFLQTGQYYIVVSSPSIGSYGWYQLTIRTIEDANCTPTPHFDCPSEFSQHEEGQDEGVCEDGIEIGCGARYCGEIAPLGDRDVFSFTLEQCRIVTMSVFGNATLGHYGYANGLNPALRLFAGPACDHPLQINDDYNGTSPAPVGTDSRIVTMCLRPATYWAEISGNNTVGHYEFFLDCLDQCPNNDRPLEPDVTNPAEFRYCLTWPAQGGTSMYYIWRQSPYQNGWELVGTSPTNSYCETLSQYTQYPGTPNYMVATNPCSMPTQIINPSKH